MPRLLRINDVAERLNLSVKHLRFLIDDGRGPRIVRFSPKGTLLFTEDDIDAFVKANTQEPRKARR